MHELTRLSYAELKRSRLRERIDAFSGLPQCIGEKENTVKLNISIRGGDDRKTPDRDTEVIKVPCGLGKTMGLTYLPCFSCLTFWAQD